MLYFLISNPLRKYFIEPVHYLSLYIISITPCHRFSAATQVASALFATNVLHLYSASISACNLVYGTSCRCAGVYVRHSCFYWGKSVISYNNHSYCCCSAITIIATALIHLYILCVF